MKTIVKLVSGAVKRVPTGVRSNKRFLKLKNLNNEYFEVKLPFSKHGFWKIKDSTLPLSETNIIADEKRNIAKDIKLSQEEYKINISNMLETKAKELGFQSFYNASAYLTQGDNPLKASAEKLGVWGGNVWGKSMEIQTQVQNGTISMPQTWEELKAMLPEWI